MLQQPGRDHRRQREHGTDGQVDPARQDHEAHADRDHEQERVVDQQVEDHLQRQEARVHRPADAQHRHEQHDGD
jgi:hypothetical protein